MMDEREKRWKELNKRRIEILNELNVVVDEMVSLYKKYEGKKK